MSEGERHSYEPWIVDKTGSPINQPCHIANHGSTWYDGHYKDDLIAQYMTEGNARRAVACVNFCRHIPTEVLESLKYPDDDSGWTCKDVTAEIAKDEGTLEHLKEAREQGEKFESITELINRVPTKEEWEEELKKIGIKPKKANA